VRAVAACGVVAIVILPAFVAAASLVGRQWLPSGDHAVIARRVADVGGQHTPLVGVYSRFGWDHPGPLMFWALAPFRWTAGDIGLLAGTAALNAAGLALALWVAFRRGGWPMLLWIALLLALVCHGLGTGFLIDPWNPYLPVTALCATFLLAWAVACGDTALWPWLIGTASWVVQAHLGFAPVVAALLVVAVGCRGLAARWLPAQPVGWHPGPVALVVGLVAWSGPILQQLTSSPGNLHAIVSFILVGPGRQNTLGPPLGLTFALHVAARQLSIPPPWLTGHDADAVGFLARGAIVVPISELAALVVLAVLAWRRQQREAAVLAGMSLAAVVAGVFGLSRIVGFPAPYLAKWMLIVAWSVPLALGWCLAALARPFIGGLPHRLRVAVPAGLVAATSAMVALTIAGAASPAVPDKLDSDAVAVLVRATAHVLDARRSYLVVPIQTNALGPGVAMGLPAALGDRGVRAFLPTADAFEFGAWHTSDPHHTDATLLLIAGADRRAGFVIPRGAQLIASFDPLRPEERALATTLENRIRAVAHVPPTTPIEAAVVLNGYVSHGAAPADVAQLAALQRRGDDYFVYLQQNVVRPARDAPSLTVPPG